MKKFIITRKIFDGDNYQCIQEFDNEAEFLVWALGKKHLGNYQPYWIKSDDATPFQLTRKLDERVVDLDGEESYTEFKIDSDWSFEEYIEPIVELDTITKFENEAKQDLSVECTQFVHKIIAKWNLENNNNPATMLTDSNLVLMFECIGQGRPDKLYNMLQSYHDVTYYSEYQLNFVKEYIKEKMGY